MNSKCECGATKRLVNDYYWKCDACEQKTGATSKAQKVTKEMVEELVNSGWVAEKGTTPVAREWQNQWLSMPVPLHPAPDKFSAILKLMKQNGWKSAKDESKEFFKTLEPVAHETPAVGHVYRDAVMGDYMEVEMVNHEHKYVVLASCHTRHTHLHDRVVRTFKHLYSAYDRVTQEP